MDTGRSYGDIVKTVINKYAKLRPSHGQIRLDTVFDEQQGNYALMQTGWNRGIRVRGNLIYITIRDEKVHIEYDGIERGIVDDLIKKGIPQEDVVLEFLAQDEPILVPA